MNKIKTYKDSKEFPLEKFERIQSTGNFFYMIKGYEYGDETEANEEEMQEQFNLVVQDYVTSLNAKNYDIIQYGKINASKVSLLKFEIAKSIILLQIQANELRGQVGMLIDDSAISEMMRELRVPKKTDLTDQILILDGKIEKLLNDISEAEKNIEKNDKKNSGESDINEIITNVELILERSIDLEKTSLYRFGIMQDQAKKKIESINKHQR